MDPQSLDFVFVADDGVRLVLDSYHSQAVRAFKAESYLVTIVGCGAVLVAHCASAQRGFGTGCSFVTSIVRINSWNAPVGAAREEAMEDYKFHAKVSDEAR